MGIIVLLLFILSSYFLLKKALSFDNAIFNVCGSFIFGSLVMGLTSYLSQLLFKIFFKNSYLGLILIVIIAIIIFILIIYKQDTRKFLTSNFVNDIKYIFSFNFSISLFSWICLLYSIFLNFFTFRYSDGKIEVVFGAWGDIMYHHAYVRSISIGDNIPVEYPYFANNDIHYHFMFDYLAGVISKLSVNSVLSLNIMSTIGLFSLLLLIFEFGKLYFNSTAVGILGSTFLVFHSSISGFLWLFNIPPQKILSSILKKEGWLSNAKFESWGLFNNIVFINQRHFAFGLSIILMITIYIILLELKLENNYTLKKPGNFIIFIKDSLIISLLVGMTPYWNAPISMICLLFLFSMAIINIQKKDVAFTLGISTIISFILIAPQLYLFSSGNTVLAGYPKIKIGYAAESSNIIDILSYYFNTLGFKTIITILAFIIVDHRKKIHLGIFLIPFIIANIFQMGVILYDNNKLLFISLIFINCYCAYFIVWLFNKSSTLFSKLTHFPNKTYLYVFTSFIKNIVCIFLIFLLTFAGIIDFFAVLNLRTEEITDNSDFINWIKNNTPESSVFLTDTRIPYLDNPMTQITLSGRKLFCVVNMVDSSCDVNSRKEEIKNIYSFENGFDEIKTYLQKNKIDYILISKTMLLMNDMQINIKIEDFEKFFHTVYNNEEITIFKLDNQ